MPEAPSLMLSSSQEVAELYKALNVVQASITGAKKDSVNPFFKSKYADLASVWDACREPLLKNGFSVLQSPYSYPQGTDGSLICGVVTRLCHNSGQWIEGQVSALLPVGKPQEVGSAITYLRRYALAAIVGVCPEDDDAEATTGRKPLTQATDPKKTEPEKDSRASLTKLFASFVKDYKPDEIKALAKEIAGRDVATTENLKDEELRTLVQAMSNGQKPKPPQAPKAAPPKEDDANYIPASKAVTEEIQKIEEHMGHQAFDQACGEFMGKSYDENEITEAEAAGLLAYLKELDAPAAPEKPTVDGAGKPIDPKSWGVCGTAKRKGCGKEIIWRTNERTKKPYPVDPETGENHLKTCPVANAKEEVAF